MRQVVIIAPTTEAETSGPVEINDRFEQAGGPVVPSTIAALDMSDEDEDIAINVYCPGVHARPGEVAVPEGSAMSIEGQQAILNKASSVFAVAGALRVVIVKPATTLPVSVVLTEIGKA